MYTYIVRPKVQIDTFGKYGVIKEGERLIWQQVEVDYVTGNAYAILKRGKSDEMIKLPLDVVQTACQVSENYSYEVNHMQYFFNEYYNAKATERYIKLMSPSFTLASDNTKSKKEKKK